MSTAENANAPFGTVALICGGAALLAALVHFFGGPFAPQNSVGTSLGEIAGEAGKAALRNLLGQEQPGAKPLPWTIDRIIWLATALTGGLATVLAVVAFVRKEPRRMVIGGAALGIGAIVFQFAAAIVMGVLALLLIGVILGSLGIG